MDWASWLPLTLINSPYSPSQATCSWRKTCELLQTSFCPTRCEFWLANSLFYERIKKNECRMSDSSPVFHNSSDMISCQFLDLNSFKDNLIKFYSVFLSNFSGSLPLQGETGDGGTRNNIVLNSHCFGNKFQIMFIRVICFCLVLWQIQYGFISCS